MNISESTAWDRVFGTLPVKNVVGVKSDENFQVAFAGLFGSHSQNRKLQQYSIDFLLLVLKKCSSSFYSMLGPIVFSAVKKLLAQNDVSSAEMQ